MAPRIIEYTNNFDTGLSGATGSSTGTAVGQANAASSGDADNEYVFFSGGNERARLELNADVAADARVKAFSATMQLDVNGVSGQFGNGQPDGISFNLTSPTSLPTSTTAAYEYGSPVGLAVQVLPYTWDGNAGNTVVIVWNGQALASTSLGTVGVTQAAQPFTINVDDAGNVDVSWGNDISVNATIPGSEWATVDQTGWDFIIAGRSGGNGGEAYIDDLELRRTVACFTSGTEIETVDGTRAIEDLRAGDLVWTLDKGFQPVRWIGVTRLNASDLARAPHLRPVRIAAGALGDGTPRRDLLVSPQHRVLVKSKIAERMFGAEEVLVAAKQLLALDGIDQVAVDSVDYVHFLCSEHQIVMSNGALTESMYGGAQALAGVAPEAREEILELFPHIIDEVGMMASVRFLVPGSKARKLAQRHFSNGRALFAA